MAHLALLVSLAALVCNLDSRAWLPAVVRCKQHQDCTKSGAAILPGDLQCCVTMTIIGVKNCFDRYKDGALNILWPCLLHNVFRQCAGRAFKSCTPLIDSCFLKELVPCNQLFC